MIIMSVMLLLLLISPDGKNPIYLLLMDGEMDIAQNCLNFTTINFLK